MSLPPTTSAQARRRPEFLPARRVGRALLVACAVLALAACAAVDTKPDLRRLYRGANLSAEQPPLIVIPGIMGSKLRARDDGSELWPGSVWNLVSNKFDDLALGIDPATLTPLPNRYEAFDIT
ncbi:MAG: hypothetical protein IT483_08245, partial [Gammaproteobacteria bacterium]|nr:hypothetical protein [Gammaproteobacteria bacterium]